MIKRSLSSSVKRGRNVVKRGQRKKLVSFTGYTPPSCSQKRGLCLDVFRSGPDNLNEMPGIIKVCACVAWAVAILAARPNANLSCLSQRWVRSAGVSFLYPQMNKLLWDIPLFDHCTKKSSSSAICSRLTRIGDFVSLCRNTSCRYIAYILLKYTYIHSDKRFCPNSSLKAVCATPIARITGCVSSLRI